MYTLDSACETPNDGVYTLDSACETPNDGVHTLDSALGVYTLDGFSV